ncbi:ribonuclease H-like domain-containing protein [Tanacetum coccineum]
MQTVAGDGITSIKRRHRDLSSDGVRNLATALGRGRLKEDLESSTIEAEYRGVANVVAETCWLRNLLRELRTPLSSTMLVYYDNVSVVYLSSNPFADIFTKGLSPALFEEFRSSLSVRCSPALTAG